MLSIADFNVKTIDDRGWYACKGSVNYLQLDGTIRHGVNGESGGFWPSKEAAEKAVRQYVEEVELGNIVDKWTPIGLHQKPYKVVLTARAGDLVPVAAFFLIDNHSGEKIWLRDTEGPCGFELKDGGLELADKTGRYGELYRPPTHFMEILEMPIWVARTECKDCHFYQQGPLFEPDIDKCTSSLRPALSKDRCAGFWDGEMEL